MERRPQRGMPVAPLLLLGTGLMAGAALWAWLVMLDRRAGLESLSAADRQALARVLGEETAR